MTLIIHPAPGRHIPIQFIRRVIEDEITRLIDLLDAMDGDPDLEEVGEADDADDEASLGWTGSLFQAGANWQGDVRGDDREWDGDDLEPDVDVEPHGGGFDGSGSGPEAVRAMS